MASDKCFHCGDDCGLYPVVFEDKHFCCNGCKTVYEILRGNKLYKYYQIENSPGNKLETNVPHNKYAYLENAEIKNQLLDFNDGEIGKVTFFIPSIHCSSCIWLLENLNTLDPGIILSKVNFTQKKVYITFNNEKTNLKKVAEILDSISYTPDISIEDKAIQRKSTEYGNKLIIKLGIAGFCFGNIMLLSFPEYFSSMGTDEFIIRNFRWINLALSLPVFFYSSSVFFDSAFKNLLRKNINIDLPVALGIMVIFARSVFEIINSSGPGYMDSMTGLVFFLLIGRWYQNKTYQALSFDRGFRSYFPLASTVVKDGDEISVPINEIRKGDLLLIRNKELIPVDSQLTDGHGNIDYSFVTGESMPVSKKKGENLFAGGRQVGSIITVKAAKEVSQSYFTQLWNKDAHEIDNQSLTGIVNRVSKYFIFAILFMAVFAFFFWQITDPSKAFDAFTAILIIACPCALALSAPFTFGSAMRIFAKRSFFIKDTSVIESLSRCDTIVFDKTGTLTKNNVFDIEYYGDKLNKTELTALKTVIRNSSHPLSLSIYNTLDADILNGSFDFNEVTGQGIIGKVENLEIKFGSPEFTGFNNDNIQFKGTVVCLKINELEKGYFECRNHYRPNMKKTLKGLQKKYELHLLSGDSDAEKVHLQSMFFNLAFNQRPEDKLHNVSELIKQNKNVLMIGDGLNDAGALTKSNVGISLADNVYQFSPACDAILGAESFDLLPKFLSFPKTAMKILYISFIISFLYNIIGLSYAFSGKLQPVIAAILMPISSVTVVSFATISIIMMAKLKKIV